MMVEARIYYPDNDVLCLEHERPLFKCHELAMRDYGIVLFSNCQGETHV